MARLVADQVLDASLDWLKNNAIRISVCDGQPTTYAEANTTYMLAFGTIDSTDFTHDNGDVSGRKTTISAQNSLAVATSGTADHIALYGTAGSGTLLYVTTCTDQVLTSGNTVNVPAWDIEIRDPAAP